MKQNFKYLMISRLTSVMGDSFAFVVLLWWLGQGGLEVTSGYYVWYYLPAVLFAIPLASWAEKRYLQTAMQVSSLVRVFIFLIFIFAANENEYLLCYILIFINSICSILYYPAGLSMITQMVPGRKRAQANGYASAIYIAGMIGGQVGATYVTQWVPYINILLSFSVLLWALSIFATWKIKTKVKHETEDMTHQNGLHMLKAGVRYVIKHKALRSMFIFYGMFRLIEMSVDMINIDYLHRVHGKGAEHVAIMDAFYFSGTFIGSLITAKLSKIKSIKFFFVLPMGMYVIYFLTLLCNASTPLVLGSFAIAGVACGILDVYVLSFIQKHTEEQYNARVFGIYGFVLNLSPLISTVFVTAAILRLGGVIATVVMLTGMILLVVYQCLYKEKMKMT